MPTLLILTRDGTKDDPQDEVHFYLRKDLNSSWPIIVGRGVLSRSLIETITKNHCYVSTLQTIRTPWQVRGFAF